MRLRPGKQGLRSEVKQGRVQRHASFHGQGRGKSRGQRRRGSVADAVGAMLNVMQHRIERRLDRDRAIGIEVLDSIDGTDLDLCDLRSVWLPRIEGMGNRRHERIHQYRETRDPDMQALPSCPFSHAREYSKNSCLTCISIRIRSLTASAYSLPLTPNKTCCASMWAACDTGSGKQVNRVRNFAKKRTASFQLSCNAIVRDIVRTFAA